ncbi:putative receptor protein kinase ZmPK1 [Acorus gramineus]|uniref:Receptor-like serine/threonine-protein kinase n=1 Tax=Acorus gramineus TaxID=55184 RepID=A0AAV9ATH7_ACOGR|nr:putative receptor protein kinase ZmPK1 [Acorus gramineus]
MALAAFQIIPHFSLGVSLHSLTIGKSLAVERPNDTLVSNDGTFAAGFHNVGDNAYIFAVWFAGLLNDSTIVWTANRDYPVNGRRSHLTLQTDGNLVLSDAGVSIVWSTDSTSHISAASASISFSLGLSDTGNLMLKSTNGVIVWQSFDHPTDTLLPNQPLTRSIKLVSWQNQYDISSGSYSLFFDNDNMLKLLYNGPDFSSIYWPYSWLVTMKSGRSTYNNSCNAVLDESGGFLSSDLFHFFASDRGFGPKRRLTLDYDGNLRLYSLDVTTRTWSVTWQAIVETCKIHGACGPNTLCNEFPKGRMCSCPPGFVAIDPFDMLKGCNQTFTVSCPATRNNTKFLKLTQVDFYGYDLNYTKRTSRRQCKHACLRSCDCKAAMYREDGTGNCYRKTLLLNGRHSPNTQGGTTMFIKIPKDFNSPKEENKITGCPPVVVRQLSRDYSSKRKQNQTSLRYLLWFVSAFGGVEFMCIAMGWWFFYGGRDEPNAFVLHHLFEASLFRRFTYNELKKATGNFHEENVIGRGGTGIVYKGVLSDKRKAAIKRLEGSSKGRRSFWRRLLVYEYAEHGSLADHLSSEGLDCEKRFNIALGTARGLAYLHEECLQWVLHLDVKPQNILLDENYQPRVADFGLSKLLDRRVGPIKSFSRVRGTRGYMAPEWIMNRPITSKVDVYSYGIVVLEMVTCNGHQEPERLVPWVREVISGVARETGIEEIMDPNMRSGYDVGKIEKLIKVALLCVDEEMNTRPTMAQVVEMLLLHNGEDEQ